MAAKPKPMKLKSAQGNTLARAVTLGFLTLLIATTFLFTGCNHARQEPQLNPGANVELEVAGKLIMDHRREPGLLSTTLSPTFRKNPARCSGWETIVGTASSSRSVASLSRRSCSETMERRWTA